MTVPKRRRSSPPPAPKPHRVLRSHAPSQPSPPSPPPTLSLIATTNAIPLPAFAAAYVPQPILTRLGHKHGLRAVFNTSFPLPPATRESCLKLVEETSAAFYAASGKGWDRKRKEREMGHPAMRYLLLWSSGADGGSLLGFLSFMITDEDGWEVVYCYEVHLVLELRGKGVGRELVRVMEMVGRRVGLQKAMLTVFKANEVAVKAYERWGYGVDEYSPGPKRVKGKGMREPDYVILSKRRKDFAVEEEGVANGEKGSEDRERDGPSETKP